MQDLEDIWREQGVERPLRCRMGIHTDYCTVGNFGSEDRMDYTIVGGGVNTAARLEKLAVPGEILISYETYAHVHGEIACEARGETNVKGIAYPLATYRVLGARDEVAAERARRRVRHTNLSMDLNLTEMNENERREAAEVLRAALSDLESSEDASQEG